jgi:hypothetical protein
MVRPRLVQEGTPLTDDTIHPPSSSHVLPSPAVPLHHTPSAVHSTMEDVEMLHHPTSTHTWASHASEHASSSLQRAVGGKATLKVTTHAKIPTHYVIGGEQEEEDLLHAHSSHVPYHPPCTHDHGKRHLADYEMDMDRHDQITRPPSPPTYPPSNHATSHLSTHSNHPTVNHHPYYHSYGHHPTHYTIGVDTHTVEGMEGIEDHSTKTPLIVLDGPNLAHAYHDALNQNHLDDSFSNSIPSSSSTNRHSHRRPRQSRPSLRGIHVAACYFQKAHVRVRIVVPATWQYPHRDATDEDNRQRHGYLNDWRNQGLLVIAPPHDDDDAYALTIAQRETARACVVATSAVIAVTDPWSEWGGGYVVSNDQFRDAQARDVTGQLTQYLQHGVSTTTFFDSGPGRISYAFCDLGVMNDRGERELDLVPNPRHPLVVWIEQQTRHVVHRSL